MTAAAGKALPQGDATVATVRKMLDEKGGVGRLGVWQWGRQGKGRMSGSALNILMRGEARKNRQLRNNLLRNKKTNPLRQEKGAASRCASTQPPAASDKAKYPALSDDSISKITAAKGPVKSLWAVLVTGVGEVREVPMH